MRSTSASDDRETCGFVVDTKLRGHVKRMGGIVYVVMGSRTCLARVDNVKWVQSVCLQANHADPSDMMTHGSS